MTRTALILAGAFVLNLGVMAMTAEAQQRTQTPAPRTTPGPVSPGSTSGAAVWDPTGTGGCTPGSPISGGTGNPCGPAAYPPFHYEYLPSERCYLQKVEVNEPDLCLRLRASFGDSCTRSGGAIQEGERRTFCVLPSNELPRLERSLARSGVRGAVVTPPLGNPRPGGIPPRN